MFGVKLPIPGVFGRNRRIIDDQEVFRVGFFCPLGEVERAGNDGLPVDHHHLVVRDAVFGVYVGWHSGIFEKVGGTVFLGALARVEEDRDLHAALVRINNCLGNGCAGETVSLNQDRPFGFGQFVGNRVGATAIRRKENFDFGSVGSERQQKRQTDRPRSIRSNISA